MIAQLKGLLSQKTPDGVIIDVQGVGYEVAVTKTTFDRLPPVGEAVSVQVHTHVTENAFSLFGFLSLSEKALFRRLISVSGIGPKIALQILSGLTPQELVRSLLDENLVRLTAINGVGKKTAERLILELKDKVLDLASADTLEDTLSPSFVSSKGRTFEEVLSALINLGYNRNQAEKVLSGIPIAAETSFQDALKGALAQLAK